MANAPAPDSNPSDDSDESNKESSKHEYSQQNERQPDQNQEEKSVFNAFQILRPFYNYYLVDEF